MFFSVIKQLFKNLSVVQTAYLPASEEEHFLTELMEQDQSLGIK